MGGGLQCERGRLHRWLAICAADRSRSVWLSPAIGPDRGKVRLQNRLPGRPRRRRRARSARSRSEGTQRIENETVLSYLLIQPGDAWDTERIDKSLKALFATGLFADVNLDRAGSTLVVKVVENPIINRIAFEGNSKLADKDLNGEIQLRPRVVYTRTRVQNDVKRILDLYRRHAHFAATVEPKVIQLSENRVDLVFEINEGPSTGVRVDQFRRQQEFQRRHAAQRHRYQGKPLVSLLLELRHLRSRPAHLRPRAAAEILSVAGLCRFPRRLGGRRDDARPRRLHRHASRSTKGGATSSARSTSTSSSRTCRATTCCRC